MSNDFRTGRSQEKDHFSKFGTLVMSSVTKWQDYFFPYLASYNNENLPQSIKSLLHSYKISNGKIPQNLKFLPNLATLIFSD